MIAFLLFLSFHYITSDFKLDIDASPRYIVDFIKVMSYTFHNVCFVYQIWQLEHVWSLERRRLPNCAEPIRVHLTKSSTHDRRATRGGCVYYFLESSDVNIQNIARRATRACMRSKQLPIPQLWPILHMCHDTPIPDIIQSIHHLIIGRSKTAFAAAVEEVVRGEWTATKNGRTCVGRLVGPLKKD